MHGPDAPKAAEAKIPQLQSSITESESNHQQLTDDLKQHKAIASTWAIILSPIGAYDGKIAFNICSRRTLMNSDKLTRRQVTRVPAERKISNSA